MTSSVSPQSYWKNKKTGKMYTALGTCKDATNSRNGTVYVRYIPHMWSGSDEEYYVREEQEFFEKFEVCQRP